MWAKENVYVHYILHNFAPRADNYDKKWTFFTGTKKREEKKYLNAN